MKSQNIIPEQKQEALTGNEKIAQSHAELKLCRNERDSIFWEEKNCIRKESRSILQRKKSYLELSPPGAKAESPFDGAQNMFATAKNRLHDSVTLQTTDQLQMKQIDHMLEANRLIDKANATTVASEKENCLQKITAEKNSWDMRVGRIESRRERQI